jgi:predicted ATPase
MGPQAERTTPVTLDRIEVQGFKSIGHMDLHLERLNVLIGANGAGKSNFIAVFDLLRHIVDQELQDFVAASGFADALLHFGQKRTSEIAVRLELGLWDYQLRLAPAAGDLLYFKSEVCNEHYESVRDDVPLAHADLGQGHRETRLHERVRQQLGMPLPLPAASVLSILQGFRTYHFHDTSKTAKVKLTGDIGDNQALRHDASNLAAFLYLLGQRDRDAYLRIRHTVSLVAPFFTDFSLRPAPANEQKIQLEWKARGTDAYFNAHSLSDGTLRFICLATLLLQPELPGVVLIDEPELGLHPYAIGVLAGLLRSAAERAQIIVSTQSVTLVNQLDPAELVVVDREDDQSVFRRVTDEEMATWLDGYSLGELWEKNILGGRPR